jgi:hypothetical protein
MTWQKQYGRAITSLITHNADISVRMEIRQAVWLCEISVNNENLVNGGWQQLDCPRE